MGAFNYKRNDYVCLALNTDELRDVLKEEKLYILKYENPDYDEDEYELDYDDFEDCISSTQEECECILDDYTFENFKVYIEPGYYEGFQIITDTWLDSSIYEEEKDSLREELSKLKECLTRLATECGLVSCYPGWCTGWAKDLDTTLNDIQTTIDKMDDEIESLKIIDKEM